MKQSVRSLALELLQQIEQGGAYSNLLLQQKLSRSRLEARDRALVTEIVYGTLQHKRYLDYLLQPLLKGKKVDNWVKQLLRLSIYQLELLDRIPAHAILHEAVEIAKSKGHKGIASFVNGVLRQFQREQKPSLSEISDPFEQIAIRYSHPSWLVQDWIKQFGLEETEALCAANNVPPPLTIRVNTLKLSREALLDELAERGLTVEATELAKAGIHIYKGGNIAELDLFKTGNFTIQDEGSMVISDLVDPKPGMTVLDACSAPGGKATHLAQLMNNEGTLWAIDLHAHKTKLIEQNAKRLGHSIIKTKAMDARQIHTAFEPIFDMVLVDAPCSGLGVIRRKPDLKWTKQREDSERLASIQLDILTSAAKVVKPGGTIVYSTCTLDERENQQVIHSFLKGNTDYEAVEGTEQQLLPHRHQTDGFYMIKLKKVR